MFFVSFFALINSLIIIPLTGGDNIIFFSIPIRIYPSQILLSLSKVQMKKKSYRGTNKSGISIYETTEWALFLLNTCINLDFCIILENFS